VEGVKYISSFRDMHDHLWSSFLTEEGHTGPCIDLKPTSEPLVVEYLTDSDDLFDPIKPTKADLNVISTANFSLADLYEDQDMAFRARIFHGANIISSWTNDVTNPYETLVTNKANVISLINTTAYGRADSNAFTAYNGESFTFIFRCHKMSGTLPTLVLTDAGWTIESKIDTISEGWNIVNLTAGWDGSSKVILWNNNNAVNCELFDVYVFRSSQLYMDGWVDCGNYEEPYEDFPYPVTIKITDGLSYLKDIIYKDSNDDYYNGRISESQIVISILEKIGYTSFKEFVNIYETTMTSTSAYSSFDQIAIDADVFKDMYCFDVLQEICKKYGAILRQWNGVFTFQRPVELTQTTINGRYFTDAITRVSVTLTPEQHIRRLPTYATDILQVPGGVQMIHRPIRTTRYIHDFGDKVSWIDNYDLKPDTFSGGPPLTSQNLEYWTRVNDCVIWSVASANTNDTDGVVMGSAFSGNLTTAKYLQQIFAFDVVDTDNIIEVGFSYKILNTSGGTINGVGPIVVFKDLAGDNYLNEVGGTDGNYAEWTASVVSITANSSNIPDGGTDWLTYNRTIVAGLPVTGPYEVRLYGVANTIGLKIEFKDIIFRSTSEKIAIKRTGKWLSFFRNLGSIATFGIIHRLERTSYKYIDAIPRVQQIYEKTNNVNGAVSEYTVMLGDVTNEEGEVCDSSIDNIIEQFAGALAVASIQSLTQAAAAFVSLKASSFLPDVTLGSVTDILVLTSNLPGTDFTGTTSITTVTGDLTGTVSTPTANSAGSAQESESDFTGSTSGSCEFDIDGVTRTMYFGSSLTNTLDNFIYSDQQYYPNQTLTRLLNTIVVVENAAYGGFTLTTTNLSGNLDGADSLISPPTAGTARVDNIQLSGTNGTATVVCNGYSAVITVAASVNSPSTTWNTISPGLEDKPLIDIISDEVAYQSNRGKQFIQMAIQENSKYGTEPNINILGNFKDSINLYGGSDIRIFVMNAGEFDVKRRKWSIDLIEVLEPLPIAFDYVVDHDNNYIVDHKGNYVIIRA